MHRNSLPDNHICTLICSTNIGLCSRTAVASDVFICKVKYKFCNALTMGNRFLFSLVLPCFLSAWNISVVSVTASKREDHGLQSPLKCVFSTSSVAVYYNLAMLLPYSPNPSYLLWFIFLKSPVKLLYFVVECLNTSQWETSVVLIQWIFDMNLLE